MSSQQFGYIQDLLGLKSRSTIPLPMLCEECLTALPQFLASMTVEVMLKYAEVGVSARIIVTPSFAKRTYTQVKYQLTTSAIFMIAECRKWKNSTEVRNETDSL